MPTNTTNYGLLKPNINSADDEDLWGDQLNSDLDSIDGLLKVGIQTNTSVQTTGYSVDASADRNKLLKGDATSGTFSYALPPAATAGDGFRLAIKKIDASANAIIIDPDGSELIDGVAMRTLPAQNDFAVLVSDGVGWKVIGTSVDLPIADTSTAGIVELATSAETQTGTDGTRAVTPAGLAPHSGLAKAWVTFTVTGTTVAILKSYNVSGVVRNQTGDFTISFTTPMADGNYAIAGWCQYANNSGFAAGVLTANQNANFSANSCRIQTGNTTSGNPQDLPRTSVVFFD